MLNTSIIKTKDIEIKTNRINLIFFNCLNLSKEKKNIRFESMASLSFQFILKIYDYIENHME